MKKEKNCIVCKKPGKLFNKFDHGYFCSIKCRNEYNKVLGKWVKKGLKLMKSEPNKEKRKKLLIKYGYL